MRNASRRGSAAVALCVTLATTTVIALVSASAVVAQTPRVEELVSAVVRVNTHIAPDGRTVQGLGREREGSGIVIDSAGLVLTIGYRRWGVDTPRQRTTLCPQVRAMASA